MIATDQAHATMRLSAASAGLTARLTSASLYLTNFDKRMATPSMNAPERLPS
jgi:hypothetical protein